MDCQVVGCRENALPWGIEFDVDDDSIRIYVCRRHERLVSSSSAPARAPLGPLEPVE